MRIGNLSINTDIYKILTKLREQLRLSNSVYLRMDPKESGDYLLIQCPYHKNGQERHPSAQLRKKDGLFYCFNCKKSVHLDKFIYDLTDISGKEWLQNNFQVSSVEDRDLSDILDKIKSISPKIQEETKIQYINKSELAQYRFTHPYMFKRKLNLDTIRKFDIGYDKDYVMNLTDETGKIIGQRDIGECITFPNKDPNGNILFIARRAINTKFFHYPKGVDKPVYGLYEIYRERRLGKDIREIYICESMLDCLAIWSWGKYAVALNGTGSSYQYDILRNTDFRTFILATDNDFAGQQARIRFKEHITNKFIKEIDYKSYNDCKDINEMEEDQFLNANIIGGLI